MKKPDIYQLVTIILSVAILVSIGVFIYNLMNGGFGKTALNVDVERDKATVIINGKDKGQTPVYTEEINTGNVEVQINGETNSYSTIIKPAAGTTAVIRRELGVTDAFSSGLNIWFVKTNTEDATVSVISPKNEGVSVVVDGVEMGKSPLKFATKELLKQSEDSRYMLTFKKDGYQDQELEVLVKPGYELNIKTDMFLKPMSKEIKTLSGLPTGVRFVMFFGLSDSAFVDRQGWAKGISYWLNSHGSFLLDDGKIDKIDHFIDDAGKIYNKDANEIKPEEMKLEDGQTVVYLGLSDKAEISTEATASLEKSLGGGVSVGNTADGKKIKIKPTGIGYLKVRGGAGTANAQVGTVDEGKEFISTEVKNGWYKIEYETGKEGWVSGTYVEELK